MSDRVDIAVRGLEAAVNVLFNAGVTADETVTLLTLQAARLRLDHGAAKGREPQFRYVGDVFGKPLFESVPQSAACGGEDLTEGAAPRPHRRLAGLRCLVAPAVGAARAVTPHP